jgi:hypothetical protein
MPNTMKVRARAVLTWLLTLFGGLSMFFAGLSKFLTPQWQRRSWDGVILPGLLL